jgi:hypothetical protein
MRDEAVTRLTSQESKEDHSLSDSVTSAHHTQRYGEFVSENRIPADKIGRRARHYASNFVTVSEADQLGWL